MSLFRPTLLAALVFAGLTACNDPAAPSTEVAAPAPDATAPASAAEAPATGAVPAGDAAALDARLVELGWAGAAATTHAYAQACGASAGQLVLQPLQGAALALQPAVQLREQLQRLLECRLRFMLPATIRPAGCHGNLSSTSPDPESSSLFGRRRVVSTARA